MILIDFNAIAISCAFNDNVDIEELPLRNAILNVIGYYRHKFKNKYGEVIICADSSNLWRTDYFKQYKAKRRELAEKSNIDWNKIHTILDVIINQIKENFPYKVVRVDKCEGDDIIGALALYNSQVPIMIVSPDKDFVQLQMNENVHQHSTVLKKQIVEELPYKFLFNLICRGDSTDGIPNVLSDDNIFLEEGSRQKPLRQIKIDEWYKSNDLQTDMGEEIYTRYIRNKTLIDLQSIPENIRDLIIDTYTNYEPAPKGNVMKFFMKNRLNKLTPNINKFIG